MYLMGHRGRAAIFGSILLFGAIAAFPLLASNPLVPITILHTNDMHSHYRPNKDLLGLGGIARLKTLIDGLRKNTSNTLLVDGGDWSEGQIYYTLETGVESFKMMDRIGYDVMVVGNHDWLNGPDILLDGYNRSGVKVQMVGANFNVDKYPRAEEFKKKILNYTIKEVNGIKIAFIGLVTYEFVFDSFISPIQITFPVTVVKDLCKELKPQVDAIVVISHNGLGVNEKILKSVPDVDLIVGAHDHIQLNQAIKVARPGYTEGWLVEAGSWGNFLGEVNMNVAKRPTPTSPSAVSFQKYKLHQVDSLVDEDPDTLAHLEKLEALIEQKFGWPIFKDNLGENKIYLGNTGIENGMGNFTTDAYRLKTDADIALDQANFIYGRMSPGFYSSADIFNSNPAIHGAKTDKAWTLKTFTMQGKTLQWLLNILLSSSKLADFGILSTSGMQITFDPLLKKSMPPSLPIPLPPTMTGDGVIREVLIRGQLLQPARPYKVAAAGGVFLAIEFLNRWLPSDQPPVPLDGLVDTGLEDWRIMADYFKSQAPLTADKVVIGNRLKSFQPDLAVLQNDVSWTPVNWTRDDMHAKVKATIHNFGATTFTDPNTTITVYGNKNKLNLTSDPDWVELAPGQLIPNLKSGDSITFEWDVTVPGERDLYPATFRISGSKSEVNLSNNETTLYFKTPL